MNKITEAFNSTGWTGAVCILFIAWILLAGSIWLLSPSGSNFGKAPTTSPRDAPWTPPGTFIGAIWSILYTLMELSGIFASSIFASSIFAVLRLWPFSRTAALMIFPVTVWITIATASILDGARRFGW